MTEEQKKDLKDCAKKLLDYCKNGEDCANCVFVKKNGECAIDYPLFWGFLRLSENARK